MFLCSHTQKSLDLKSKGPPMEEGIVTDPVLDKDSLSLSTQKVGFRDRCKYDWQNPEYKEAINTLIRRLKGL